MCTQIRFNCFDFCDAKLKELAHLRSSDQIRMHVNQKGALLPIEHHGEHKLVAWGNQGEDLPKTGYCKLESLEDGKWQWLNPEPVRIIASFAWSKGVWFQVRQGIRGILVYDRAEKPHCFLLTQPATHYFKIMTGADRMPVLIDQIV